MNIRDIAPTDDADYGAEQLFIAGQKGRGKSRLTDKLIRSIPPAKDKSGNTHGWCVVIVDSKQDWEHSKTPFGKQFYKRLPSTNLRLVRDGFYVYRPTAYPEKLDQGARRIFRSCLKRKYCVIVIDEGADFGGGQVIPELGKLLRQGRSKHVIIVFGCQRPTGVTLLAITEANRLICFQLGWDDDYKRMAVSGYPQFQQPPAGRYDFNYFNRMTGEYTRVRQTPA